MRFPIWGLSLFLLALGEPSFADKTPDPLSAVSLHGDFGANGYHDVGLNGTFQFDEAWDGDARLNTERTSGSGNTWTGEGRAVLGYLAEDKWRLRAGFLYDRELNSINGVGFDAGVEWLALPHTDEQRATSFGLDFSAVSFRQRGSQALPSLKLLHQFTQHEFILHWNQEIADNWRMTAFVQADGYQNADDQPVITATGFRQRPLVFGNGEFAGFPRYAMGLILHWRIAEYWRASADYAHVRTALQETNGDSLAGDIEYQFDNDWWLGFRAGDSSQQTNTDISYAGISLTYEF